MNETRPSVGRMDSGSPVIDMRMRYISLFSGIEAASVAWIPLGWTPVAFCEVDPFACAVLRHHYPSVPNLGDITKADWSVLHGKSDVVVGGSPCQSFSIAGKREGLRGKSGSLMYEYIRAVREIRPNWFVWENVPGALTVERGEAFRQFLSEMDVIGYGMAWRILDAQFFGVAQRRRRVYVVGHLGDMRAGEALFESESMCGNNPSSKQKREALARTSERRIEEGREPIVLKIRQGKPGGGKGALIGEETSFTLSTSQDQTMFQPNDEGYVIRRFTPTECERLQGFPDAYTDVQYRGKPASDTARYKSLGNSFAVPVIRWIGERINAAEDGATSD